MYVIESIVIVACFCWSVLLPQILIFCGIANTSTSPAYCTPVVFVNNSFCDYYDTDFIIIRVTISSVHTVALSVRDMT